MTSDGRGFTQEQLATVLKQLDEVLDEAERVRIDVLRQLAQPRPGVRPIAPDVAPRRRPRKKR